MTGYETREVSHELSGVIPAMNKTRPFYLIGPVSAYRGSHTFSPGSIAQSPGVFFRFFRLTGTGGPCIVGLSGLVRAPAIRSATPGET